MLKPRIALNILYANKGLRYWLEPQIIANEQIMIWSVIFIDWVQQLDPTNIYDNFIF